MYVRTQQAAVEEKAADLAAAVADVAAQAQEQAAKEAAARVAAEKVKREREQQVCMISSIVCLRVMLAV